MTFELLRLIHSASIELGSDACRDGKHDWAEDGGRECPKGYCDTCSQTVYRCRTCGGYDYGSRDGPAHQDCFVNCRLLMVEETIE